MGIADFFIHSSRRCVVIAWGPCMQFVVHTEPNNGNHISRVKSNQP